MIAGAPPDTGFEPAPAAADGRLRSPVQPGFPPLGIDVVDPTADPDWDREVLLHPDAGFFHGSAWAKVLCQTYGHEPLYLRCARGGAPVTLLPLMGVRSRLTGNRGVCLPFADVCGPLHFGGGSPDPGPLLREALRTLGRERRWRHVELRGGSPVGPSTAHPPGTFYGHTLRLHRDEGRLFDQFKGSVRGAIRIARRGPLRAEVTRQPEAMRDYYRLHARTRRRHGLPPQPWSFFQNIHEAVIARGFGFAVLVRAGGTPVAGAVFFHLGKRAIYKFGASDVASQALRPSNLALWVGIQELARNGLESLHLGRTARENDGLRRFKLGWGTTEESIGYRRSDPATGADLAGRDDRSGWHHQIFRHLPGAVNRLAGALIYPHLD